MHPDFDPDDTLFKYYPFNEYSEKVLTDKEIFFANRERFNDVYENHFGIETAGVELPPATINQLARQLFDSPDLVATFCLSRKCNESLMWAHYAENHTGFCLALSKKAIKNATYFRRKDSEDKQDITGRLISGDVEYQETPPLIQLEDVRKRALKSKKGEWGEELISKILYTKSTHWTYEDEFRFVLTTGEKHNGVLVGIPEEAIKGVIFGARTEEYHQRKISYSHRSLKLYKAVQSQEQYNLIIHNIRD
ncbi:DUF2971 domain-containing protein [Chromobacterium haemolyticum]|uniref:DUF2971 domain-containing protein n=1 Tax=Chromobacterium TaxID=535 RepID=UPI0040560797